MREGRFTFRKQIPVPLFFKTERMVWNLRFYRYTDNFRDVPMLLTMCRR